MDHPIATKIRQASAAPDAAVDFFALLLHPDPEVRCSALEATQHPYLQSAMSTVPLTTATSLSFEEGWECDTVAPLMFKIPDDVSLLSAWSTSESLPSSQQSQVFSVDEGSASTAADMSGHIDSSALHASVEFCQDSGSAALQQRADVATSTDSRVTGSVHTAVDSKPGKQSGSVLSLHADCTMSAASVVAAAESSAGQALHVEALPHASSAVKPDTGLPALHISDSSSAVITDTMSTPAAGPATHDSTVATNVDSAANKGTTAAINAVRPAAVASTEEQNSTAKACVLSSSTASSNVFDPSSRAMAPSTEQDGDAQAEPQLHSSCGLRWSWKRRALVAAGVVAGVALGALAGSSLGRRGKLR